MGNYYETFYPPFFMDTKYKYDAIAVNPKGYDRDNKDILADFAKRMDIVGDIDIKDLKVSCEGQVITLRGSVATQTVLVFLEHVASNVLGVRDVKNQLTIRRAGATTAPKPELVRQDDDIGHTELVVPDTTTPPTTTI
jgi:hypothetical protein